MLDEISWSHDVELMAAIQRRAGWEDAGVKTCTVDRVPLFGGDLESRLRHPGVSILEIPEGAFVGLLSVRGNRALVLAPDLSVRRMGIGEVMDMVLAAPPNSAGGEIEKLLDACATRSSQRLRARRALLCERLRERRLGYLRQLSVDPGVGFLSQLRDAGLFRTAAAFLFAHTAETFLWLAAWWVAGLTALSGRVDPGWMLGWALLLAALIPVRVWAAMTQGRLSIGAGGLLKQRLLAGTLRLEPSQIAQEGAGRFFSRVAETGVLESLALSGGLASAVSLVETVVSGAVLWQGAAGGMLVSLYVIWLAATAVTIARYARRRALWTRRRLGLTHHLVEQMTGHRTRLAQEPAEDRHSAEDAALDEYLVASARLDSAGVFVATFLPYSWLLAGVLGLMPAFAAGANAARLAVTLGGILLAQQALRRLTAGAAQLTGAVLAWRGAAPMFQAATKREPEAAAAGITGARTVVDATDLQFRYRENGPAVLDNLNLRIESGDWVLLESESGKGKSTLVALLAGLREPAAGLLTSGGLDRRTVGAQAWRKRIAAAPQYHENHILTGTLAFNLLLGRAWPPSREDLAEAAGIAKELGLDRVIERMPGGLMQMVGETGWQLSQGERSRVFLARALLQQSEMVILDESFAALDPESLRQAMECTLRRAKTLLVVAHP